MVCPPESADFITLYFNIKMFTWFSENTDLKDPNQKYEFFLCSHVEKQISPDISLPDFSNILYCFCSNVHLFNLSNRIEDRLINVHLNWKQLMC